MDITTLPNDIINIVQEYIIGNKNYYKKTSENNIKSINKLFIEPIKIEEPELPKQFCKIPSDCNNNTTCQCNLIHLKGIKLSKPYGWEMGMYIPLNYNDYTYYYELYPQYKPFAKN